MPTNNPKGINQYTSGGAKVDVKHSPIARGKNKAGETITLSKDSNNTYSVWRQAQNYNGSVKGGKSLTQRYIKKDISKEEALRIFKARTVK